MTEAEPGVVYNQDGIKITMFDVDHKPVSPAVGYRFDYQGRIIVISGDTIMVPAMIGVGALEQLMFCSRSSGQDRDSKTGSGKKGK